MPIQLAGLHSWLIDRFKPPKGIIISYQKLNTGISLSLGLGLALVMSPLVSAVEHSVTENRLTSNSDQVALANQRIRGPRGTPNDSTTKGTPHTTLNVQTKAQISILTAAQSIAQSALFDAIKKSKQTKTRTKTSQVLSLVGKPGDVRLVCMSTGVISREKNIIPPLPLPPFSIWRKWLIENELKVRHCALDWVDENGNWWHTEMRGYYHHPAKYRVGEGEHIASGYRIYGIFVMPGRTHPEGQEVFLDELIKCDYRDIERTAKTYARKDKKRGDAGTGGNGSKNVGLGGPCFRPSQCSNTYVKYLLMQAGVNRKAPDGAFGWITTPRFPYSSNVDAD